MLQEPIHLSLYASTKYHGLQSSNNRHLIMSFRMPHTLSKSSNMRIALNSIETELSVSAAGGCGRRHAVLSYYGSGCAPLSRMYRLVAPESSLESKEN